MKKRTAALLAALLMFTGMLAVIILSLRLLTSLMLAS